MSLFRVNEHQPSLPEQGRFWIAPTAVVIGQVVLERDVSVWFNAVLRGDLERILVGEGSNIQDNCVLHTDVEAPLTIGRFCTIGHCAVLHACTIGDNSLVGIGATVLDHTKVGKNCIVAAHSLILQKQTIPDNSLVIGAPGKVVRTLSSEESEAVAQSATGYIENWKRFASTLQAV